MVRPEGRAFGAWACGGAGPLGFVSHGLGTELTGFLVGLVLLSGTSIVCVGSMGLFPRARTVLCIARKVHAHREFGRSPPGEVDIWVSGLWTRCWIRMGLRERGRVVDMCGERGQSFGRFKWREEIKEVIR